jgi:hypothetical protein
VNCEWRPEWLATAPRHSFALPLQHTQCFRVHGAWRHTAYLQDARLPHNKDSVARSTKYSTGMDFKRH